MRYRVQFAFIGGTIYYSEWLDTLGEAKQFAREAFESGGVIVYDIEDENWEVI